MATKKASEEKETVQVSITAPKIRIASFVARGSTHLSVCRFAEKAKEEMRKTQEAGSVARTRTKREPKDFNALFEAASYRSKEGWYGVHAACFRCAAVSACRLCGFKMVLAKLGIFTIADGHDVSDGTPLIRIWGPPPEKWIAPVRNANGEIDLRARPRWAPGEWELRPRMRYDSDMFTLTDVTNLMMRIGLQVGICEGRPDSRKSAGLEYGLFDIETNVMEKAA